MITFSPNQIIKSADLNANFIVLADTVNEKWWQELGRTTLTSTDTTITVASIAPKKYIKMLFSAQASGAINTQFTFNNDSSNLYRSSYIGQNSGTNTDTGAIANVPTEVGTVTTARGIFITLEMYNPDDNSKYGIMQSTNEQNGSGTPAWMYEGFRYVSNAQVARIDWVATTGSFLAGSEVIVLGHN